MPGATSHLAIPYPLLTDAADIESFGVKNTAIAIDTLIDASNKQYKTLMEAHTAFTSSIGGSPGTYLLTGSSQFAGPLSPGTDMKGACFRYLNPTRFPGGGRTGKLGIVGSCFVNQVSPGGDVTLALYPLTAAGGNAGNITTILGTVVSGSAVTFSAPATSSTNFVEGPDFTFPSAGYYAVCATTTGSIGANGAFTLSAALEFRTV